MHIIYAILIALVNNIDNITVRVAYSLRGIRISHVKNLWISLITFFISFFAASSGSFISSILSKRISSILSAVLLTAIGLWIILEQHIKNSHPKQNDSIYSNKNIICSILENPEVADIDESKDIDFKEATLLGIALSINNIGGGLSAGIIGLNSFFIGIFSALISFIALWSGNYLTKFLNRYKMKKRAIIFSGLILIIIGIKQVI